MVRSRDQNVRTSVDEGNPLG